MESSSTTAGAGSACGYGTQRRKDLSGSISSVNAATIEKVPVTTVDQLCKPAAGVQVTNNDAPQVETLACSIRGVGIRASGVTLPLYVC
jgi:outer membrane receptor for ferrienterochelin and colicin